MHPRLNLLFGIVGELLFLGIIVALSRRLVRGSFSLAPVRWVPITLLTILAIVMQRLAMAIGYIAILVLDPSYTWNELVFRAPGAAITVVLFPLLVWEVALARGAREPRFAEIWRDVWRTQPSSLALLIIIVATRTLAEQAARWLMQAFPSLPNQLHLSLAIAASAGANVLVVLLAIISLHKIDHADLQEKADRFA